MNYVFLITGLCMVGAITGGYAQDTTRAQILRGLRIAGEVGILNNPSLTDIQNKLVQTNINAEQVGSTFANLVLSFVRDTPKGTSESRFLYTQAFENGPRVSPAIRRARLYGFGIGLTHTYKLINTRRFIVGPTLGYDVMWYRLSLLAPDRNNLLLANIANNPAVYSTTRFRQGLYLNLHGAVGADYRFYWLKKFYDEFRLGARVGYQLPFLYNKQWSFSDGTVADLPAFRANMLYYQVGLTVFGKRRPATRP